MNRRAMMALALGLSGGLTAATPFAWPHGAKYAVSLTYDDALVSQLKNAVPALNKAGLHGTFYLSGDVYKNPAVLKPWKAVAKAGHELGSHTVTHPCPGGALETFDLATMEKELTLTRQILVKLAPGAGQSFAYPCGADYVGKEKTSYKPLVAKYFKSARNAWGGVADPWVVDLMGVPTVYGNDAKALIKEAETAEAKGGWAVFLFHGVGGDYLTVPSEAHQKFIDYLKAKPDDVWVAPFREVAAWVKAHRP